MPVATDPRVRVLKRRFVKTHRLDDRLRIAAVAFGVRQKQSINTCRYRLLEGHHRRCLRMTRQCPP